MSSLTKVNDVLSILPNFNSSDLEKISHAASVLTGFSKPTKHAENYELFYSEILDRLRELGFRGSQSWQKFEKTTQGRNFKEECAFTEDFIEAQFGKLQRHERIHIYRIFARLIIDDVEKMGLPLKINIICSQLKNLQALLDRAFPGYMQANLLCFLLLSKSKN
jgi:hypothetical protein